MTPLQPKLRAFIVAVDYSDILAVTLPYNQHHFHEITVITDQAHEPEILAILGDLDLKDPDRSFGVYTTDLFYRDGATFNKWRALEACLSDFGRHGWITFLDADILWPQDLQGALDNLQVGKLYTPERLMMNTVEVPFFIPPEPEWSQYQVHRNKGEWAGYSQILNG